MTEPSTYLYEPFTGRLENGREVLVQIFRDPVDGTVIAAQLTFRQAGGTWGPPYQLEAK